MTQPRKIKVFETGAIRDSSDGKGRFDLLPPFALERLAKHFEQGAVKYAPRNWEKGIPFSRMIDSAIRHIIQYLQGQNNEDHLISAVWNLICLADEEERIKYGLLPKALDDLPHYLQRKKEP